MISEGNGIYQWDRLYPTREDFARDILAGQLTVGRTGGRLAVIFTVNAECDPEYAKGEWRGSEDSFAAVHRLCVHPDFQNMGVAGRTMKHIEERARAEGKRSVRLDVYSGNPFALRLYQGCGYGRVGAVRWRKGLFYLMELCLDAAACAVS